MKRLVVNQDIDGFYTDVWFDAADQKMSDIEYITFFPGCPHVCRGGDSKCCECQRAKGCDIAKG